jgi:hypothetical protein
MAENKGGLNASTEQSAPEAMWKHYAILSDSLAVKELFPELSDVMDTMIRTENYVRTPLDGKFRRIINENLSVKHVFETCEKWSGFEKKKV